MAKNKESKGNFFNFVEDASKKNSPLRGEMLAVVKRKGMTSEKLLKDFHARGYDGVSLRDCRRILSILENPAQLQKLEDWHY